MRINKDSTERGATSVEYGLMVALVAIVIIAAVATFGGAVAASLLDSCSRLYASC